MTQKETKQNKKITINCADNIYDHVTFLTFDEP